MYMTPSSDGKVITTIASARCDGGTETTEIAPVGDHGRTVPGEAGDAAGNRGQHENRDGLDAVHQAELDGGVGQLIHKPPMNYLIHPHRHGRGRLPGPEQTELTVTQRCKGPQVEQAPERSPGPWAPLCWVASCPGPPGGYVGMQCTPRRLHIWPTVGNVFLAPGVFPQAISLTHDHAPCARTPCEGGKTFVDQAPRPFLGRGVCRIACLWRPAPAGVGDGLIYIRSTRRGNTQAHAKA